MNTRRYPRTLEEAFGPHTSRHINSSERNRRADRITTIGCALAAAALVLILHIWG